MRHISEKSLEPNFDGYSTLDIYPSALGLSVPDTPIRARFVLRSSNCADLQDQGFNLSLRTYGAATVDVCITDLHDWLADAVGSKLIVGDRADLILVRRSSSGRLWFCGIRRWTDGWRADAAELEGPVKVATNYALPQTGEQNAYLIESHRRFLKVFGHWARDAAEAPSEATLLRAKVDRRELWFLRFPLGMFAKLKLEGFATYSACQWIVTDRTISAAAAAQAATERELLDTRAFVTGSRIIINTYSGHEKGPASEDLRTGVNLLIEVLGQLRSIPLGEETIGIQWTMNPSPDLLTEILLAPQTRYVFADFEAEGNIWHVGDGDHRCSARCEHAARYAGDPRFDLGPFRDRLGHIRLLRVFHCNSVYDPFLPKMEPADEHTLVGQLLASKAFFVEGSLTAEPEPDFFCSLLKALLDRADLRTFLWKGSLMGVCDTGRLVERVNALLNAYEYPPIESI